MKDRTFLLLKAIRDREKFSSPIGARELGGRPEHDRAQLHHAKDFHDGRSSAQAISAASPLWRR